MNNPVYMAIAMAAALLMLLAISLQNKPEPATASGQAALPAETHPDSAQLSTTSALPFRAATDQEISAPNKISPSSLPLRSEASSEEQQTEEMKLLMEEILIDQLLAAFDEHMNLDNDQQTIMQQFVARIPEDLNDTELKQVLDAIRSRASNTIGNQLSSSIERLYRLRLAEEKYVQSITPPANPEAFIKVNAELAMLRLSILGAELNNTFYPTEGLEARPFAENKSTALSEWISQLKKEGLSDAMIAERISEKFGEETALNLQKLQAVEEQWLERYLNFLKDKEFILRAGLTDTDKQAQIEELIKTHYTPAELAAAKAFDEMMSSTNRKN